MSRSFQLDDSSNGGHQRHLAILRNTWQRRSPSCPLGGTLLDWCRNADESERQRTLETSHFTLTKHEFLFIVSVSLFFPRVDVHVCQFNPAGCFKFIKINYYHAFTFQIAC